MKIVLLCATARGLACCKHFFKKYPNAEFLVFSFREEAWEPPFFEDISTLCAISGARFIEAKKVDSEKNLATVAEFRPDFGFGISWRYMISESFYDSFPNGFFIFHDSLLPRYRGFAPTVWAMINGESEVGATLFRIGALVDEGPIVGQKKVLVEKNDYISDVIAKVTNCYLELIESHVEEIAQGTVMETEQDHSQASYCCKWLPTDAVIDWAQPAFKIVNLIKATSYPYPGARTTLNGKPLIVWKASLGKAPNYVGRIPGRVIALSEGGVEVLAGEGSVLIDSASFVDEVPAPAISSIRRISDTLI
ncbi:formyltransferase family protein [Erythrobacter sp. A6_0]|uniref:methionyl-tRNA formyltransferase n=1 Tax=Erythrobacter sp. A6_0 TaxID=2821089 RepID=UPI001ADB0C17|nr:formyltransferase family protein [Erythrobacter sp. A6_0]MBO9511897.1 hypothetical protein [Erythrobacter sp. A6_0]